MQSPFLIATFTIAIATATAALSQSSHQPYKGFEKRGIASLSDSDVDKLTIGAGWGLALPAELNGYPGPKHVLELADELALSSDQITEMQSIYEAMKVEAIAVGGALIDAERNLDLGFASGELIPTKLRELIAASETARAELRFIHLSRHLESIDLLDSDQISKYAELRGYTSDPCQSAPSGHDPSLWRRHNGCEE